MTLFLKKTFLILTLTFSFFSLFSQGKRTYFPNYLHSSPYGSNLHIKWENGISIDTLVKHLGVQTKCLVNTQTKKSNISIKEKQTVIYDPFGRIIEKSNITKRGNWFHKVDYTQKNKTIRETKYSYAITERNDSNRTIRNYSEYRNKKGKVKQQYLNTNTYTYGKWRTASFVNKSKKDTSEMLIKTKYYYSGDTGDLIKKELYKKGKLNYTYVYDCSLAEKIAQPKKDSTRVCQNKATDDRGYTYYTSYSYKENRTFKTVSVTNAEKKLIEYYRYIVIDGKELPTYIYKNTKDSSFSQNIYYSKNLKKKKHYYTNTAYKDKRGRTIRVVSLSYNKYKTVSTHYQYYKYNSNGLMKSSSYEHINSKNGKIYFQGSSDYYYTFFNS